MRGARSTRSAYLLVSAQSCMGPSRTLLVPVMTDVAQPWKTAHFAVVLVETRSVCFMTGMCIGRQVATPIILQHFFGR